MSVQAVEIAHLKSVTELREKASEAIAARGAELERLVEDDRTERYLELRGM